MGYCASYVNCDFFNNKLQGMPSISKQLKKQYCELHPEQCARHMIKKKVLMGYTLKDDVTLEIVEGKLKELFPNDSVKAKEIISTYFN